MISIKPLTEEQIKKLKVTNSTVEYILVNNLLGQIRTWLSNNRYDIKIVNTLLLNKLLYFIIKGLNENNPHIKFSGGWYRYGPCLEEYRIRGEDGTTDLTIIEPSPNRQILAEVKTICEEEIPLFFEYAEKDKYKKYFYHYLEYVYSNKCEYEELKEYYISKNNLAYSLLRFAFNKEKNPNLKKYFLNFQRAVVNKKYTNFVKIKGSTNEIMFNYLTEIKKLMQLESDGRLKNPEEFWFVFRKVALDFERTVLGEYSYKNYIATYKDINPKKESVKKKGFEIEAMRFEQVIKTHIISNIEWIDELIKVE